MKNAKKHVSNDPPTAKSLSQLIQQFIQMQASLYSLKVHFYLNQVSNNSSQSQSLVNNNTGNHLLALQRLVNGNTQLDSNNQSSSISNSNQFRVKSQQQEQSFSPLTTRELTRGSLSDPAELTKSPLNRGQAIKLPAKKRPYINENVCESDGDVLSDTSVNNESSVKRSRSDMDSVSSAVRESTSGPCSPLNLLQKMHLSLDSYLMR